MLSHWSSHSLLARQSPDHLVVYGTLLVAIRLSFAWQWVIITPLSRVHSFLYLYGTFTVSMLILVVPSVCSTFVVLVVVGIAPPEAQTIQLGTLLDAKTVLSLSLVHHPVVAENGILFVFDQKIKTVSVLFLVINSQFQILVPPCLLDAPQEIPNHPAWHLALVTNVVLFAAVLLAFPPTHLPRSIGSCLYPCGTLQCP
jgi:hypothetical protein